MAVDPMSAVKALEWSVGSLEGAGDLEAGRVSQGGSFGSVLGKHVASLNELQNEASSASQELALGQAEDPSAAVLAVERARLSMQLATSVRGKLTEAFNDVMRTQV